ncbi:MAG: hypothetical protein IKE32_04600 [Aeriscardovia sp.]|nr:hypothetical protein [Aeriscardovia sp.]
MAEMTDAADETESLTLRHLRSLRWDIAAVLENQARDRQLITRLAARMDQSVGEIRRDIADFRGDVVLLENGLLNRHNEILATMRRLDDIDAPRGHDGEDG